MKWKKEKNLDNTQFSPDENTGYGRDTYNILQWMNQCLGH